VTGAIESISQLGLHFFGLNYDTAPQVRAALFTQIHEICFHGQGGYDWNTVYNMPIWLRRFTFNQINNYNKSQSEELQSKQDNGKTNLIDPTGKVNVPEFAKVNQEYKKPAKYK
jgi:hypothetical protein